MLSKCRTAFPFNANIDLCYKRLMLPSHDTILKYHTMLSQQDLTDVKAVS